MASELWQRIRSARQHADLKQDDIAKVCGVTRPAVSLWESKDPTKRTKPDINQIQALAKLARLPVEYFLNDKVEPESVWEVGKQHKAGGEAAVTAIAGGVAAALDMPRQIIRNEESLFASALQYYVFRIARERGLDPQALEGAFSQRIPMAVTSWAPDFFHGKLIVEIASQNSDLDKVCANLLTAERATGSKLEKLILYRGTPVPDTTNLENLFGIHLLPVTDPRDAAELIVDRL